MVCVGWAEDTTAILYLKRHTFAFAIGGCFVSQDEVETFEVELCRHPTREPDDLICSGPSQNQNHVYSQGLTLTLLWCGWWFKGQQKNWRTEIKNVEEVYIIG